MRSILAVLLISIGLQLGCTQGAGEERAGRGRPGGPPGMGGRPQESAAVPVEVAAVTRRGISSFIETNGVLEAENEVDIVARTSAPIAELLTEEGREVRKGQLLARLDDEELRAQVEIARVNLSEAEQAHTRAKTLFAEALISSETFEQARSTYESALAQLDASRIQLGYAEIRAPFAGKIIKRYVQFAEQVSPNTPLFRLSDFDPLLCPIQVPERQLQSLFDGQKAHLTVEPWPGEEFEASVLRISPVVDSATGTVKVTLEVRAVEKLRPGMFARVFLETASRPDALVIPRAALSLESIGDTVYVAENGVAARREVELGFHEGDFIEVVSGLVEGERVVVVGQDGLSEGTPVQVLSAETAAVRTAGPDATGQGVEERARRPGPPGSGRGRPDFSQMTPEQIERVKERMRARGMTDEQIEERLRQARESSDSGSDQ